MPASEHRPPNRGAGQLPHHRCEDRHRITVDEHIVFVDANGMPTGEVGPKLASHHQHTRRHLGFSCYLFRRGDDALLVTRRAHTKKVWPGVWTNSFCGQPAAGEAMADALRRRAFDELRISALQQLQCVLPTYTYKTPAFSGVVEHEFCPVYTALTSDTPLAVPDERPTASPDAARAGVLAGCGTTTSPPPALMPNSSLAVIGAAALQQGSGAAFTADDPGC
jgi:isopentenyl-diphosphate Delta-isomerase